MELTKNTQTVLDARGVTLKQAQSIINSALTLARQFNSPPLSIVVLDNGGHPKAMVSEDGVGTLRAQIAQGKANAALGMGFDSGQFYEYVQRGILHPMFAGAINGASQGKFIPLPGGVLIKANAGETSVVIGAVGISGASSDVDQKIALQAIREQGLAN